MQTPADRADLPFPTWVGLALLGAVVGALVSSHPLVCGLPPGHILGAVGLENAVHDWALWIASQEGWVVDTRLADWPDGWQQVLADPLNLPIYRLGWGRTGGFHLVQLVHLLAMGLTAGLIARGRGARGGAAAGAAVLATTCCAATTFLHTGMTEVGTLWLAAAAMGAATRPGWRWTVATGVLLGVGAWGGPYTLVIGALGVGAVVWGQGVRAGCLRLLGVGLSAAVLAAPVVWTLAVSRPAGLPGSVGVTLASMVHADQLQVRMLGSDPLAWIWPRGGEAALRGHGPYLGLPLLALAAVGLRRRWMLGVGAGWLLVLSMGGYLQLWGEVPRPGGALLTLPAAWLSMAVPPIARMGRWVRASVVAAILVAALAGVGADRLARRCGRWRPLVLAMLVGVVAADGLLRGPIDWPRATTDISTPAALTTLSPPGPLLVITSRLPPGVSSSRLLSWQVDHGMPVDLNPMFGRDTEVSTAQRRQLERVAASGRADHADAVVDGLRELGFVWVVRWKRSPGEPSARQLSAMLGEPTVDDEEVVVWRLQP